MGYRETSAEMETNVVPSAPRLRVNRMAPLALTTSWQQVVFNGTSPYNVNSFTTIPGQSTKSVYFDSGTNLLRFSPNVDQNYLIVPSLSVTSNTLLTSLNIALFTFATLQLRCYIPAPTPVAFPLPDFGGYVDFGPINATAATNHVRSIPVYANQIVRDYGVAIHVRLSNTVLGTVTLNGADLNVFRV